MTLEDMVEDMTHMEVITEDMDTTTVTMAKYEHLPNR